MNAMGKDEAIIRQASDAIIVVIRAPGSPEFKKSCIPSLTRMTVGSCDPSGRGVISTSMVMMVARTNKANVTQTCRPTVGKKDQ